MKRGTRTHPWPWLACLTLLLASLAQAQAPTPATDEVRVPVKVDVVSLSNDVDLLEPKSLVRMKATFDKQGLHFRAFRRLSSERVEVSAAKPTLLQLPNGNQVRLQLESLKEGTARVKVAIPGLLEETLVTLGRKGTVYQAAGDHGDGKLVLVLKPSRR